MRLVASTLSTVLGSIVVFASLVSLFGYFVTALITVVGALILWVAANQAVEKASPQPTVSPPPKTPTPTTPSPIWPTLHAVCQVGPYEVEAGEVRSILLDVKQGQRVKGHLEEVDGQPFDWYITDEKSMVLLKKGERRKFKSIDGGGGDPAYTVSRKIPWKARWFLLLDTYGKQYSRKVRVDFEPIPLSMT